MTSSTSSKTNLYGSVLKNYEKKKDEILKTYLSSIKKTRSKGLNTLEKAIDKNGLAEANLEIDQLSQS
jgi:flagellar motor component MotA